MQVNIEAFVHVRLETWCFFLQNTSRRLFNQFMVTSCPAHTSDHSAWFNLFSRFLTSSIYLLNNPFTQFSTLVHSKLIMVMNPFGVMKMMCNLTSHTLPKLTQCSWEDSKQESYSIWCIIFGQMERCCWIRSVLDCQIIIYGVYFSAFFQFSDLFVYYSTFGYLQHRPSIKFHNQKIF